MANLNNQNYCLQKELEAFIESDEAVRQGLDRKVKVETIRHKVDDVIRRSEQEVEERIHEQKSRRAAAENARMHAEMDRIAHERAAMHHAAMHSRYEPLPVAREVTRSANHYSPARHEYVPRAAYRAEEQARTFSSDQNRLGAHEYRASAAAHGRQGRSPLRAGSPGEKRDKQVKFQQ